MIASIVDTARELADELLFPTAIETDAADLVPQSHLDAFAGRGLYGLTGPTDCGGLGADFPTACAVVETLASGCLTTTFVWAQHLGPVWLLSASKDAALRERWLPRLCSGDVRAGIALSAFRADRPHVRAERVEGGWMFDGVAQWVTGWGRNDILLTSALSSDRRLVRALVDGAACATLSARRLHLVGANASATVELTFERHFVPAERVVTDESYIAPPAYDGGGRFNGSLSLGVARRCCALIGPSPLDAELVARRNQLDAATDETMAQARAAATELALRAAGALSVATGSRSLLREHHAQRLVREATFLLTFGTRPAIRAGLLERLGASSE
ncbi:MAG: acyl-CoA dehydrogenase family protein [Dehalococcoidia bacterium]